MNLSDEEIKAIVSAHSAKRSAVSNCLSAVELIALSSGEAAGENREKLIGHLTVCSDCASEFSALADVRKWSKDAAEELKPGDLKIKDSVGPGSWLQLLRPRFLVAAAFSTVFIGVSVWYLSGIIKEPGTTARRGGGIAVMKTEPAQKSVLAEFPKRLSWTAVEEADGYQAILFDFESTKIWESSLTEDTFVEIPDNVRNGLPKGNVYYWRVITNNGMVRPSELFEFTVQK